MGGSRACTSMRTCTLCTIEPAAQAQHRVAPSPSPRCQRSYCGRSTLAARPVNRCIGVRAGSAPRQPSRRTRQMRPARRLPPGRGASSVACGRRRESRDCSDDDGRRRRAASSSARTSAANPRRCTRDHRSRARRDFIARQATGTREVRLEAFEAACFAALGAAAVIGQLLRACRASRPRPGTRARAATRDDRGIRRARHDVLIGMKAQANASLAVQLAGGAQRPRDARGTITESPADHGMRVHRQNPARHAERADVVRGAPRDRIAQRTGVVQCELVEHALALRGRPRQQIPRGGRSELDRLVAKRATQTEPDHG